VSIPAVTVSHDHGEKREDAHHLLASPILLLRGIHLRAYSFQPALSVRRVLHGRLRAPLRCAQRRGGAFWRPSLLRAFGLLSRARRPVREMPASPGVAVSTGAPEAGDGRLQNTFEFGGRCGQTCSSLGIEAANDKIVERK
jgi:hypothetical protein